MADLSDISLVTQVAVLHNKKAFDQLVRKYQSPVRRFFLNQTLGDEQLSDDLAQETFIKAYVNITKFRGMSSFSTWLMRIAYNVFYDDVRSRKQTEDIDTSSAVRQSSKSGDSNLKMDIHVAHAKTMRIMSTLIYCIHATIAELLRVYVVMPKFGQYELPWSALCFAVTAAVTLLLGWLIMKFSDKAKILKNAY